MILRCPHCSRICLHLEFYQEHQNAHLQMQRQVQGSSPSETSVTKEPIETHPSSSKVPSRKADTLDIIPVVRIKRNCATQRNSSWPSSSVQETSAAGSIPQAATTNDLQSSLQTFSPSVPPEHAMCLDAVSLPSPDACNIDASHQELSASSSLKSQTGSHSGVKTTESTNKFRFPKPPVSYRCLITLILKNSANGTLPTSDIYRLIRTHFPYFKSKSSPNWKSTIRNCMSSSCCFTQNAMLSCKHHKWWTLNPLCTTCKLSKLHPKDHKKLQDSMQYPDKFETLLRKEMNFVNSGPTCKCTEVQTGETKSQGTEDDQLAVCST